MKLDERKHAYFFERHSIEEVRSWNQRLKYFRYFRAYGGHANDSDSLDVAIGYRGVEDMLSVMEKLGINLIKFSSTPPQPVAGVSYPFSEFEKFPSLIPGTRWIKQPGHTVIAGLQVFVWCYDDRIIISPKKESLDVDESTIAAAEAIEPYLVDFAERIIGPPKDTDHYLCVAKHPKLSEPTAAASPPLDR